MPLLGYKLVASRSDGARFFRQNPCPIELWTKAETYKNEIYVLPKHLDEKSWRSTSTSSA
ncbi:MAG: S-adenosyl-L-homocysteine hydrolase [Sphingomonadales bacterium]|nr:S-adenosyl-L-homocysteine hydrolase [Sphingomonadales bacterium]